MCPSPCRLQPCCKARVDYQYRAPSSVDHLPDRAAVDSSVKTHATLRVCELGELPLLGKRGAVGAFQLEGTKADVLVASELDGVVEAQDRWPET